MKHEKSRWWNQQTDKLFLFFFKKKTKTNQENKNKIHRLHLYDYSKEL